MPPTIVSSVPTSAGRSLTSAPRQVGDVVAQYPERAISMARAAMPNARSTLPLTHAPASPLLTAWMLATTHRIVIAIHPT